MSGPCLCSEVHLGQEAQPLGVFPRGKYGRLCSWGESSGVGVRDRK